MDKSLVVFQDRKIRRTWHSDEWWFSLEDIVSILTDSRDTKQYIQKMKQRDLELAKGWVQFVRILSMTTSGGDQKMNCVNVEGAFRIIQSIPSTKAEPFKLWLARVGYDRVKEIDNPELAQQRMKEIYRQKGYSDAWIEKRSRGIAIRDELTDEWTKRGVSKPSEYAILTAEISKATFGMTPGEYRKFKGLDKENLRDHMDDLELIFTMLGEASTTRIIDHKDTQGFEDNKIASKEGGEVAGLARKELEKKSGRPVSTKQNYIQMAEKRKQISK